jgi:hypothetical protein
MCVFAEKNHMGNWHETEGRSIIIRRLWAILLLQKQKMKSERVQ